MSERSRTDFNLNQPMQTPNYTHTGFAKARLDPDTFALVQEWWERRRRLAHTDKSGFLTDTPSSTTGGSPRQHAAPRIPRPRARTLGAVMESKAVIEAWVGHDLTTAKGEPNGSTERERCCVDAEASVRPVEPASVYGPRCTATDPFSPRTSTNFLVS